jgi:hypothetical protein
MKGDVKGKGKRALCLVCGKPLILMGARWFHPGWTDHAGMPEGVSKWSA